MGSWNRVLDGLWEGHGFSRATKKFGIAALAAEGCCFAPILKSQPQGLKLGQECSLMAGLKPCPTRNDQRYERHPAGPMGGQPTGYPQHIFDQERSARRPPDSRRNAGATRRA